MKLILELSKENLELSKTEALELLIPKSFEIKKNYLILETNSILYTRLAFTKKVSSVIFICTQKELIKKINDTNFSKYCKETYAIKAYNNSDKISTRELAKLVYYKIKNPKVNLNNPKNTIEFTFIKNKVICSKVIWKSNEDYNKRKAHNRPELHPTSIHPRLARACINLTGLKKGSILDPFCGSGGILIEAGLMNLKAIGYDIDKIMRNRSQINLDYFKIKNYELKIKNALTIPKTKYIVTDPPYGRNTNHHGLKELYENFILTLDKQLLKKAVIIYPNTINIKKTIKKTKLKIKHEFSIRIHSSMTRNIIVIEK